MTMFAPSDIQEITVSEAHGGCGRPHRRDVDNHGDPVHPWGVTCQCEEFLRTDPRWSPDIAGIVPTFDEEKARERWELQGSKDKDAMPMVAMSRMAGLSLSEIPPTVQRMISGLAPHIPGQTVCPAGHGNVPGGRYCSACGKPMSAAAPAAQLPPGEAG
jgi:hypothetical protein